MFINLLGFLLFRVHKWLQKPDNTVGYREFYENPPWSGPLASLESNEFAAAFRFLRIKHMLLYYVSESIFGKGNKLIPQEWINAASCDLWAIMSRMNKHIDLG